MISMKIITFFLFVLAFGLTFGPPLVVMCYPHMNVNWKFYRRCELAAIILWSICIVLMNKICPFIND